MTTSYLDGLPDQVRDLRPGVLRELAPDARLDRLTHALGVFYDHLTGSDDEDDDEGGSAGSGADHPLIMESAVAAEMNMALEGWLGVTVPIEALLLDGLSRRALAERLLLQLDARSEGTGLPVLTPVADPAGRYEPFALSDIQQAYWIGRDPVYELGDVSASLYVELTVTGFDVDRATRALQAMLERHDMLRSVVGRAGTQQVLPVAPPPRIDVVELGDHDSDARARAVAAERDGLSRRTTSPEHPEPFEIRLLRLDAESSLLMMSVDMVKLDAWSVQLLLAEWFQLYDRPGAPPPSPVELTFRDYVRWTEAVRSSPSFESAKAYWLSRLPDLPPAPELPLVTTLDAVSRPTFTARSERLPRERWDVLKERAVREGLTPSMLLCSAYAEVLASWSRQRRFTISVAGGRPPAHAELPRILGPFARPTLLEVDMTGGKAGFRERARAVQRTFSRDMEHREFGGLDVLRELASRHGRTRASMPVIFTSVLPQAGEGGLPRPDWLVADPYVVWGMPQLLLENQMIEVDGDLLMTWVSVDEAFAVGVVDEMFAAYQDLLQRMTTDDAVWSSVESTPLPLGQEARRAEVNATASPPPTGLVHDPFVANAALRPDAPAVLSGRRDLTYGELDRQSRHVAAELVSRGIGPGDLVGVCMDRGWEQVAAVLGVLRSGAAYLPLDPELPARPLHHLFDHARVTVALTQPWVDDRLEWPATIARHRVEYRDGDVEDRGSPAAEPTDLAYVIFTSGSTGSPKGVMIEHRSVLNTVLDINRRVGIGPDDRILAVSSLSFDLSVHDVLGVLAAGGAIVVPDPGPPDPGHWWGLLARGAVTVWNSVPALLQLLLGHVVGPVDRAVGAGLRHVLLSGDWIPVGLPAEVRLTFPSAEVTSLGGATEASIWSVYHPTVQSDGDRRSIPYGLPLTNQRVHVLDDRMAPRPEMVAGDLYLAGDGLARGYLRDPERTAAAFVEHPRSGERLYRTGDVARFLRSGELEFLGREDSQVKVNGHRIELGEIESVLARHPGVATAVASAYGDPASGRALLAHVVPADSALTAEVLSSFLAERLAAHAVPARILMVDRLPLTANGKIDRAALVATLPTVSPPVDAVADNPMAPRLAAILSDLLEQEIGVHDDVYLHGANSLVAVQLVARARDAGIELAATDMLTHSTADSLASVAQSARQYG